jgi:hypothetical protein
MVKKIISLVMIALLGACASIVNGTSDQITVNSLEKDTTIYIDGVPRGKDVATADVKRGKKHALRATKEGCADHHSETVEKFDSTTLLGIAIDFGIISIPVDLISGAAWKTEPNTYTVTPICKS